MTDTISHSLHYTARGELLSSLGMYWANYYSDRDLVNALLASQVLCAAQMELDMASVMHSLDHTRCSAYLREHWHPLLIRYSQRDTASVLRFGLHTCPVVGEQTDTDVFEPDTVFDVGGNAAYSKVYTYPYVDVPGRRLVGVRTCICDSISSPTQMLVEGNDFTIGDGVLTVRREHDPFDSGNYRIIHDGDDLIAVMWLCDAEYDADQVHRYIGYPIGIDVKSDEHTRKMVSLVWDMITGGTTSGRLSAVLGELFDVPVTRSDDTVESVVEVPADDGTASGYSNVIFRNDVYTVRTARLRDSVRAGASLPAGSVLTDELDIYPTPSAGLCRDLVDSGVLGSVTLHDGCVDGVHSTVAVTSTASSLPPAGECQWFRLNSYDTADSEFWTAVRSRSSDSEIRAAALSAADGDGIVNPVAMFAAACLSNSVLVVARKPLALPAYADVILSYLTRLLPAYSRIHIVRQIEDDVQERQSQGTGRVSATSTAETFRNVATVSASCVKPHCSCIIRPMPKTTEYR